MTRSPAEKRRLRRSTRGGHRAALNLVSMVDIFTVLLFFMLVQSTAMQNLPYSGEVRLPRSSAEVEPRRTLVLTITPDEIELAGESLIPVAQVQAHPGLVFPPLRDALARRMTTAGTAGVDADHREEITIVSDKAIPYRILKKVIAAATDAGFSNVSLAVVRKPG